MVGEVKGIDVMGVLVAGRGARDRGGRRMEVEVKAKQRILGHDASNLVLETIEESCAIGEDIVLEHAPHLDNVCVPGYVVVHRMSVIWRPVRHWSRGVRAREVLQGWCVTDL